MRLALRDAGVDPGEIEYLNAHGTSTKLGDMAESLAIRTVFGDRTPAVSSNKGITGHMLGASGAVEAAATIMSVGRGILPHTYNLVDPDPACDVDLIQAEPRKRRIELALSNSFGFGGHNVSLIIGHPRTRLSRFADGDLAGS
jgi:3-oxoacyl-[acyl-carrier-protein] synthase II